MANLIILMAGEGSRFRDSGFTIPKPYIDLNGKPFFVRATESVLKISKKKFDLYFVIQEAHEIQFGVKKLIHKYFPNSTVVELKKVTGGALESARYALNLIKNSEPVLINDSDHAFKAFDLDKNLDLLEANEIQGFLANFEATSPNYSFAQYNDQGFLIRTAEKEVISNSAIAGIYGFHSRDYLEEVSDIYLENNKYSESYISGVFNEIVAKGDRVQGFNLDEHISFGTPEELTIAIKKINPHE